MLEQLKDKAEIIIAINAGDIEKNKVRGDLGITYDSDVLRLIDAFRGRGLLCGQRGRHPVHRTARRRRRSSRGWRSLGIKVYRHYPIQGYPHNIAQIVSDEGYGKNEYHRDHPPPGGGHRPRPGQRQDGHLPQPALPRPQAGA